MRSTKRSKDECFKKNKLKNCTLPMDPNCLFVVFTTIVSLIKYRARTTSSEQTHTHTKKCANVCIYCKICSISLCFYQTCMHTYTHAHDCLFNGCLIKYDEYGLFSVLSVTLFHFLSFPSLFLFLPNRTIICLYLCICFTSGDDRNCRPNRCKRTHRP